MQLGILNWLPDARKSLRADLVAGLTLWALIVPQSIAYANIAGAPTPIAGLYCVMIVLPIYALFASSRYLVPSPTTAVSATFAGFLGVMISEPETAFSSLVVGASLAYFLFAFLKLGFLTDFISAPVSMGYMTGLSVIVITGQIPALLGIEHASGTIFHQLEAIVMNLANMHIPTVMISLFILAILIFLPRIFKQVPAGLVAVMASMLIAFIFGLEEKFGVAMVGALPRGLPSISVPLPRFADLGVIIPAAIGLVVLASGEASVTAQSMAMKHGQKINMNQQFFAFGMGNLAGSLFGGMLGTGASSATMVNEKAGARTLASTLWAALAALFTVLFLTGLFAYLPKAFLSALVITAVWGMLYFKPIWNIQKFSRGEFFLSALAMIAVLVFGILNGLLLAMFINVLYAAYVSAKIKTSELGVSRDDNKMLIPLDMEGAEPLPKHVLAFGLSEGVIYYASAREALAQALEKIEAREEAKQIVISVKRMSALDYTSSQIMCQFASSVRKMGKKLHIADVQNQKLMSQLCALNLDPDWVDMHTVLDLKSL